MYNNGNKLIVNLKTSISKPNSNNKFANKYRDAIFLFWSKLLNGYGQVNIQKILAIFCTFLLVTCKKVMDKLTFKKASILGLISMLYNFLYIVHSH
jgi:hypothetical protein